MRELLVTVNIWKAFDSVDHLFIITALKISALAKQIFG